MEKHKMETTQRILKNATELYDFLAHATAPRKGDNKRNGYMLGVREDEVELAVVGIRSGKDSIILTLSDAEYGLTASELRKLLAVFRDQWNKVKNKVVTTYLKFPDGELRLVESIEIDAINISELPNANTKRLINDGLIVLTHGNEGYYNSFIIKAK